MFTVVAVCGATIFGPATYTRTTGAPNVYDTTFAAYDTRGCKVYEKKLGDLGNGQHQYVWNGKNENGISLSSGLYFVKIGNETQSKTHKVLLLK